MKTKGYLSFLCMLGLLCGTHADSAYVDYELGWIFPQKLAGLEYAATEKYANPDLGYSIRYRLDTGFEAEISVYTLGRGPIATGHTGPDIPMVIESVESDLRLRQQKQQIAGYRVRGKTVVPQQGDVRFASTMFHFTEGLTNGVQKLRAAYATGARDRFVKLDFTFNLVDGARAREMAQEMVLQLIGIIKSEPDDKEILLASCEAVLNDPSGFGGRLAAQHVAAQKEVLKNLNVYPWLFAWPDDYSKPANADLLVMAYFAGMLCKILPQGLQEGGEAEGFSAMLDAYKFMLEKGQIENIPQLDQWLEDAHRPALFQKLISSG